MSEKKNPIPTEEEVRAYFETCSNWGRWGPDDNAGTINLITQSKRLEAASLVQTGKTVSCSYPLNPRGGPGNLNPFQHFMRFTEQVSVDYIGLIFHGYTTTHIDALCHIFWEGKMWNGKPASEVTSIGSKSGSVDAWSQGIVTRGVLLDIPRLRGVDYVSVDEPIRGFELEEAAKSEGVELRPGDAILVRGNRIGYLENNPDAVPGVPPSPGLQVDCIPVLKQHDASILVWDMLDHRPTPYSMFEVPPAPGGPLHILSIVYMGLPLLDNAFLNPLAEACAERNCWEFMFTVNPLNIRGGTGSPVNPIAIL
jgi:hypothetical protein|tara:strand:- start:1094 stop:2023 length:930 start_codon:yes stop_codon:yes gene_type:complete